MTNDTLAAFQQSIFKNQPIPADVQTLFALQSARVPNDDEYADAFEAIQCRLIGPDDAIALLDHSYLSEEELANPDIAANVAATKEVFALITFVVQNDNSDVIGYWHGPEGTPIGQAAIVKYDSEGQFSLLQGTTLTEALLGDYVFDDDEEFTSLRDWFAEDGITITASNWDDLASPEPASTPDDLHETLYNQHRTAAGLPPYQ
ncbi:hypothetical protein IGB42_02969 [Andreprevotia sp. IGB-42]|uniref:hypothetical protein n=1 Tax=Andreprevotia sp. IGB-42 TaxID=2497473 RepID=UPI00135BEF62|nr:hypothetical protein [Andreprevotia sp. IGB-42]KAF0812677.1 hypothetical protein IGB42_02969 [Andreprevotia sp. IGB-42]